jgi:hypothetical protein
MLCLQQERFQWAASLPDLHTVLQEARSFQWKKTASGDDYGAWSKGEHDDLLFATAIAVWYGDTYAVRTLPGQGTQYATATGNPLHRASVAGSHETWRR